MTLLMREEYSVAEDLGGYFRVPADNRDLNYSQYFSEGREEATQQQDYNSHNTGQKDVAGMCELLQGSFGQFAPRSPGPTGKGKALKKL